MAFHRLSALMTVSALCLWLGISPVNPQTPTGSRLPCPGLSVEAGKAPSATRKPYFTGGARPQRQVTNVVEALSNAGPGDFSVMAQLLEGIGVTSFRPQTTWLMPNDQAFDSTNRTFTYNDFVLLLDYHVIGQLRSFTELSTFKIGDRMATFLGAETCVVTDDRPDKFAIDGAQIVAPEIFRDGSVAIHGIDAIMDDAIYNVEGVESSASIPRPSSSIGLFMTLAAASILLGGVIR